MNQVCKTEWAYEVTYVFDSLDNFKAWKASPKYKTIMEETPVNMEKLGLKPGEYYNGARVFNDL